MSGRSRGSTTAVALLAAALAAKIVAADVIVAWSFDGSTALPDIGSGTLASVQGAVFDFYAGAAQHARGYA